MLLPDYSPEKQLRPMHPTKNPYPYGGRILKYLKYFGICYRKNIYPMVIDLGRSWMKLQGLQNPKVYMAIFKVGLQQEEVFLQPNLLLIHIFKINVIK